MIPPGSKITSNSTRYYRRSGHSASVLALALCKVQPLEHNVAVRRAERGQVASLERGCEVCGALPLLYPETRAHPCNMSSCGLRNAMDDGQACSRVLSLSLDCSRSGKQRVKLNIGVISSAPVEIQFGAVIIYVESQHDIMPPERSPIGL